ncbi:MAG: hypothetical protein KIT83_05895 [Bryobacterales bacterium]|nr:hypothetical protein [Bryobacterales bacterium]
MHSSPGKKVTLLPLAFALVLVLLPMELPGQSRAKPRVQARSIPLAKAAPFALVEPAVVSGESAQCRYPAAAEYAVPALVLHGGLPGPVIAYVFHGFASEDAFYAEMQSTFGALKPAQMQGTVLALSLPSRAACHPKCPPAEDRLFGKLAPAILDDARFVVQIHQHRGDDSTLPHAFVYKAPENARLANYVESMARAALIPQVVELAALDAPVEAMEHLAPRSIELEHPAINIETVSLEDNNSAAAAQLRKGLVNLLHHLKMAPGAVSWQNSVKRVEFSSVQDLILPQ